jgi:two-component system, response regulator RegA
LNPKSFTISSKVLLIVEDFDFIRNVIGKEFQKNGYTIISVASIEDALLVGKAEFPSAIIVDFEMRSNDPYLTISVLHKALPDSSIIMINGNIKCSNTEKARELGAERILERDFRISDIDEFFILP